MDSHKKVLPELPVFLKKMKPSDTNTANIPVLMAFEKTACFGFCPVYEFTLFQNGVCQYHGKNFTPVQGTFHDLMTDEQWKEIMVAADSADFFNLADEYPVDTSVFIADLPMTITRLSVNGKDKTVKDSHSAPQPLKNLEDCITRIIDSLVEKHLN